MGSVGTHVTCPECGFTKAYLEYYYKSGETDAFCKRCGWFLSQYYDKQGKPVELDSMEEDKNPIGSYDITFKGGNVGRLGPLYDLTELAKECKGKDFEEANATTKKNNKWVKINLLTGKEKKLAHNSV